MASKGWNVKRFILIVIFLLVLSVAFVLLGGGNLLKSAGTWMGGMGSKAETFKGKLEEGAQSVEKKAEKVKEAVTDTGRTVGKKAEKVKEAVTSGDQK